MWIITITVIVAVYIYIKFVNPLKYWDRKGIHYIKPVPIFGNIAANVFRSRSLANLFQDAYQAFPNERYIGVFHFSTPVLLLRNPDLIKQILVKEFDTFSNRYLSVSEDVDPLWSKTLLGMKGDKNWHNMRSILNPSYTGSKLRTMFNLMKEQVEQFSQYFLKQGGAVTVELHDIFKRFTIDLVASTAFGITCNSLEHPKNEVYRMGADLTDFRGLRLLKLLFISTNSILAKIFNLRVIDGTLKNFFVNLVKETMKVREENKVYRPDMIQLLIQTRNKLLESETANTESQPKLYKTNLKPRKPELTDLDITAQVIIFFFAGSETTSTAMSHACHELAHHPEIQTKLFNEIRETLEKNNNEFSYENVTNMKYLDMVVSEILRKWPPIVLFDRKSIRPYTIKAADRNEKDLELETDSVCYIPVYALHRDPKYYPDPDKFDPERFSDENKSKILPFTYLPFGLGPRNCIGFRFALLGIKLVLAEIIRNFEVLPTAKTEHPVNISRSNQLMPLPNNGLWLDFRPRNSLY